MAVIFLQHLLQESEWVVYIHYKLLFADAEAIIVFSIVILCVECCIIEKYEKDEKVILEKKYF